MLLEEFKEGELELPGSVLVGRLLELDLNDLLLFV